MKFKFSWAILLLGLLFSCSVDEQEENNSPLRPILNFPSDKAECLYTTLNLEWLLTSDPENDPVTYKVEISESETFEELAFTKTTSENTTNFSLLPGTTYYWRVLALDSFNNTSDYSQVRSFFTQPVLVYNHFPTIPQLLNPAYGAEVQSESALLNWYSLDSDEDQVIFDVYFGLTNPPNLLLENVNLSSYEVPVEEGKTYYWKVVAKDSKGASAIGGIWKFSVK